MEIFRKIYKVINVFFIMIFISAFYICYANVLPKYSYDVPSETIGVYQTDKTITVYEKPNKSSKVVFERVLNFSDFDNKRPENEFAIIVEKKELCYLFVVDLSEDEEWVQVIYDKKNNKSGWVYKKDDYQFMSWGLFFNLYGMKYGLNKLYNSPINTNNIYSAPSTDSKIIGEYTSPKYIHLTSIEGNWALVSILDISDETYTGYVQWRTNNGQLVLFPNIK